MVLKLYYFDARNLAEPIRMVLHHGKVQFEDVRISQEDWPEFKKKFPYGKVPVLEVDGKFLSESAAIARFLARKHGLAGKTEWEQAKVDELVNIQKDFYKELAPFYYSAAGFLEPEKKEERYESVAKPVLAKYLSIYNNVLEKNGTGFFVGDYESYVDFQISEFITSVNGFAPDIVKDYPKLLEHIKRIHNLPQLKEYIATRKPSPI